MEFCTSSKTILKKSEIEGRGLFATQKINQGELVIDFEKAVGKFLSESEVDNLWWRQGKDYVLQIDDNLYWAADKNIVENYWFLNHSCDPNCGIQGKFQFVAMREIAPEEEITFDYAMSETSNYKINCRCGSNICRRVITGKDWQKDELQKKYNGFFSTYIPKKIDKIKNSIK